MGRAREAPAPRASRGGDGGDTAPGFPALRAAPLPRELRARVSWQRGRGLVRSEHLSGRSRFDSASSRRENHRALLQTYTYGKFSYVGRLCSVALCMGRCGVGLLSVCYHYSEGPLIACTLLPIHKLMIWNFRGFDSVRLLS